MSNIHHHHVKKERVDSPSSTTRAPYSLKISKDSHPIKKSTTSSPPSSTSSSASPSNKVAAKPQQRSPVIIYTYSPKIIHTHPKYFMALVQKLTGLSRSNNHNHRNHYHPEERKKIVKGTPAPTTDDNESTSVVTDDNNNGGETQVNSCFVSPAMFDPATNLCFNGYPFYGPNAAEFWHSDHHHHHHHHHSQLFNYNYSDDSYFLYMPDIRNSSPFDSMKELPKF